MPTSFPVADALASARSAQPPWQRTPVADRLRILTALRRSLATECDELLDVTWPATRTSPLETIASEILPLADAISFLERRATSLLAPVRISNRWRPWWLTGVEVQRVHEPHGVVLVIGPRNYSLFLTAGIAVQALAAGNAVLIKPAPGADEPMRWVLDRLNAAGLPTGLAAVLPTDVEAVSDAISGGVDFVVQTSSFDAGAAVLEQLAATATPAVMELSGCDAMCVLPGANLDRVAAAVAFSLRFNSSATCIAARRVFVTRQQQGELLHRLLPLVDGLPAASLGTSVRDRLHRLVHQAVSNGAKLVSPKSLDEFAACPADSRGVVQHPPVILDELSPRHEIAKSDLFAAWLGIIPVNSVGEMLAAQAACPFALAASVFGPEADAIRFARELSVGVVTVNDVIAPTADPRVSFGGRGRSGFGVTRGDLGLLTMTRPKTIVVQRRGWLPHLDPPQPGDVELLRGYLQAVHAGPWRERCGAAWRFLRAVLRRR